LKVLVTGAAGFIGSACSRALVSRGDSVVGIDNLNAYYDVALKHERLKLLGDDPKFRFIQLDLSDLDATCALIADARPDAVLHLAAQAGVRASAEDPYSYIVSNIIGHSNVLEALRRHDAKVPLVYASSSSVYGDRAEGPFFETDRIDAPTSFYAATKAADEMITGAFCAASGLAATGLRFFTVYGPMGRPDMAYWLFGEAMLKAKPITLYGNGLLSRDFTYIDDIAAGIIACIDQPAAVGTHRVYNLGSGNAETVVSMVDALERHLGCKAERVLAPKPAWDVSTTHADASLAMRELNWTPKVKLDEGIERFSRWFKPWFLRKN
jgi:UDP-glucuronate 4-epimerase